MDKKTINKTNHKTPKFRDFYDDDFRWEDKLDMINRKKKRAKPIRQRKNNQWKGLWLNSQLSH